LDDILETLFINLCRTGQLKAMPPRLYADDGINEVIRPLAYVEEAAIISFAAEMKFPVIPCCLCADQESHERKTAKKLIAQLAETIPEVRQVMLHALRNVRPTHLLDLNLFDPKQGRHEIEKGGNNE
jgi:tRNA 2-thiocytidine biosynthesis protein TtcA